jgi:hypothetical protein
VPIFVRPQGVEMGAYLPSVTIFALQQAGKKTSQGVRVILNSLLSTGMETTLQRFLFHPKNYSTQ